MWKLTLLGVCCVFTVMLLASPASADDKDDLIAALDEGGKLFEAGKLKESAPLREKALRLAPIVFGENHEKTAGAFNYLCFFTRLKENMPRRKLSTNAV